MKLPILRSSLSTAGTLGYTHNTSLDLLALLSRYAPKKNVQQHCTFRVSLCDSHRLTGLTFGDTASQQSVVHVHVTTDTGFQFKDYKGIEYINIIYL